MAVMKRTADTRGCADWSPPQLSARICEIRGQNPSNQLQDVATTFPAFREFIERAAHLIV
jgi:hypothetical protein